MLVLERGKAYPPGSFPRTPWEIGRAFWDPSESLHGLYDVWSFHRLDSIVSSGLGGGSLIYANVILRRPESWFADQGDERWPIGPADLEEHYEAVERELGATPYPWADTTPKTRRFREAADVTGLGWREVNLAVSFAESPGAEPEAGVALTGARTLHGMQRSTCRRCGECDVGCNFGAKNTLDHTYLTRAHRAGARHPHALRRRRDRAGGRAGTAATAGPCATACTTAGAPGISPSPTRARTCARSRPTA